MKKRRTFDIELPEDPAPLAAPDEAPAPRRSPMAAAIAENADALRERRSVEDRIRAENDALAAEHVRMKKLGLIVDLIPLDQIDSWKLIRDRAPGDDQELVELIVSVRDIGLSNPIRVEAREDGRYELVQGFRRLAAYRHLLQETGDAETWGRIPAGILPRGEDLEALYRRMVDENLVRKDISFAEMAMLALNYARDPQTAENDPDRAVAELFKSAGYQKRSYIRQFIRLMDRLGDDLSFAHHIPRSLGLKLVTMIEAQPELVPQIRQALKGWDNRSVLDELGVLRRVAGETADGAAEPQGLATPGAAQKSAPGRAKTTFQIASPTGPAKCTAANGRLEIKMDLDFSALDRRRLEAALSRLLSDIA